MQKIDAHQHFWKYDPVRDSWISESMSVIRKDFLPADLEPLLKKNGFDGCVVVQSEQSEQETTFQLANAEKHDFIKGVVGWVDLRDRNLEDRLKYYKEFRKLKGFRHILQGESKRDLMLDPDFRRGIGMLHKYGFTYDVLIFPDQLGYTSQLVSDFPDQRFVLDHLAKPYIKFRKMSEWKSDIKQLAVYENVFCKISGMVTEADWQYWTKNDLRPYLDVVVEAFGTKRIMFGSDWPVCLVAAEYEQVLGIVTNYFSSFSKHEKDLFFGYNAIEFYNL